MDALALKRLIDQYKSDSESVYNTWFIGGEERMKAFRAIRRGVRDTVDSIAAGTFGNDFKGSPLEVVLTAITEQKQVFEGAAHPFFESRSFEFLIFMRMKPTSKSSVHFLRRFFRPRVRSKSLLKSAALPLLKSKGWVPPLQILFTFFTRQLFRHPIRQW
jgi:hypothetical protein